MNMLKNMFNINPGKTEVLHFTSRVGKQPSFGQSLTFAGTTIDITKKITEKFRCYCHLIVILINFVGKLLWP